MNLRPEAARWFAVYVLPDFFAASEHTVFVESIVISIVIGFGSHLPDLSLFEII